MELTTVTSEILAQLLTAWTVDSLSASPSFGGSFLFFESSCRDVGWDFLPCQVARQPKHTPFDLRKATRSWTLSFIYSKHSSRLWFLRHNRQRADGQTDFWPASPPVEVKRLLAEGGRSMRLLTAYWDLLDLILCFALARGCSRRRQDLLLVQPLPSHTRRGH